MKRISLLIILTVAIQLIGISQSISPIDSIIFYGGGGYQFTWSSEHVADQIYLSKDTNLFTHQFRQHLLVDNYYGTYEIKNDSLILECTYKCGENGRGLLLGPIVIPMIDGIYKDTLILSRADGSQNLLSGSLFRSNDKDSIVIYDKDLKYTEIIEESADYYIIKIDYKFHLYDNGDNKRKIGFIQNDKLLLDSKIYSKSEYEAYIEPINKKKKKRKK